MRKRQCTVEPQRKVQILGKLYNSRYFHSFTCLLNTYCGLGTALDVGSTTVDKTDRVLAFKELICLINK